MKTILKLIVLPLYLLNTLEKGLSDWNIIRVAFGKGKNNHEIINGTVLRVHYPKGSYSPSKLPVGGIGFYSNPDEINMATEVLLKYQVKFDKTFDPVLGGKLPGLFINTGANTTGGSGGKHTDNASCRIAWRANFSAEAYLYLPTFNTDVVRRQGTFNTDVVRRQGTFNTTSNQTQSQEYNSLVIKNGEYGDSLWRNKLRFDPDNWNDVSIQLRLNNVKDNIPIQDGLLQVTINNITQKFDKIIWRTDTKHFINTIIFETFFGGSSPKTATPHDTWTYFQNVQVQKIN